jgi:hypothetical protein
MSRRDAMTGAAVGAAALGAAAGSASAATTPVTVAGSWRITPQLPAGAPAFVALAAFGAGGVLVTTGSDEPGTGIGQWKSTGSRKFVFAYTNFHFDGSGALSSIVDVQAKGTFHGKRMSGTAELRRTDAGGNAIGTPRTTPFAGTRMPA